MSDWHTDLLLEASARAKADIALGALLLGMPGTDGSYASAATAAWRTRVVGDANPRFEVDADGKHWWGDGTAALDTNLYRVSADNLKTDDSLTVGTHMFGLGNVFAQRGGGTSEVGLGTVGPSGQAGATFGVDANLYRLAAGVLQSDGTITAPFLTASGEVKARSGGAGEVFLGIRGPGGEAGITFGVAADTNLYRAAANTLQTDDKFVAALGLQVGANQYLVFGGGAVLGETAGNVDLSGGSTATRFLDHAYLNVNMTIANAGGVTINRGDLGLAEASNIGFGPTTGTKIGTATTQKLAFWNATPIVQPANTVDYVTMLTNLGLRATGGTAPASFPGAVTSSSPTLGMGYATGAGGTVTQITSRTTGVTLNKICGQITTHTASLAAGAEAEFTVTNSTVEATDVVNVAIKPGGTGTPMAYVSGVAAGSFKITITNLHASTADTSADVINFAVTKSVAA